MGQHWVLLLSLQVLQTLTSSIVTVGQKLVGLDCSASLLD
jgi:hypothetical protein